MEYALPVCKRVRDILDINVHLQDWKGRDLTHVVDTLSKKVLSVEDFKVEHKDGLILASYKKEDFSIKYESNNRDKKVDFTVRDGENWLRFFVGYNRSNNIDRIYLYANNSYFWVDYSLLHPNGKLDRFPKKVYDEESARGIVNKGKEIERYLSSTIENTKVK